MGKGEGGVPPHVQIFVQQQILLNCYLCHLFQTFFFNFLTFNLEVKCRPAEVGHTAYDYVYQIFIYLVLGGREIMIYNVDT